MTLRELPGLREDLCQVERYMLEFLPPEGEKGKMAEIIRAVMGPAGKRYRPRLVLLAGRLGPGDEGTRARLCKLGALLELIHMASLVHDDIVDDSPLRRGQPTVQSRFGKDMAVYTGDLILGRVMQVLFREGLYQAGEILSRAIEEMCRGEIGQFDCRYRTDSTVEEYMEHIYGKTASLFAAACRLGGTESGCDKETVELLAGLGEHLGYLFQLRDDLLDFLSDELREGKPVHMDFREGIFTLPVLYALAHPQYGQKVRALARRAEDGLLTGDDLKALDQAVCLSGGLDAAVALMDCHRAMAQDILRTLPQGETTLALTELFQLLTPPQCKQKVS